jgi:hypothetical protein
MPRTQREQMFQVTYKRLGAEYTVMTYGIRDLINLISYYPFPDIQIIKIDVK